MNSPLCKTCILCQKCELPNNNTRTGKTDIHGQEIYYDFHIVRFKFNDPQLKKVINCIGVFGFNEVELRAEIDIYNNPHTPCLWYLVDDMTDFEIIGNVKKNPELIGEGK